MKKLDEDAGRIVGKFMFDYTLPESHDFLALFSLNQSPVPVTNPLTDNT